MAKNWLSCPFSDVSSILNAKDFHAQCCDIQHIHLCKFVL